MTNYHTPDLTGAEQSYYESNLLRTIIKAGQVIQLDSPVFDNDSLELFITGTNLIPMVRDVDYKIDPNTDIDYDMMSRMRTIDPSFEAVLIRSISIMKGYSSDYKILLRFNRLFPNIITYSSIEEGPEVVVTPELVSSMIDEINFLKNVIVKEMSNFTSQSLQNNILSEDPLGNIAANNILGEIHSINTLTNQKLIKPVYGDFYKDTIRIINLSSGADLVIDVDFRCVSLDLVKTNNSSNASGVYKYIELIVNYVGNLSIDYHAYGGEATVANMRTIDQQLKLAYDYLNKMEVLTPNLLQTHPAITRINNKINELEARMRLLLSSGIPSYGDSTNQLTLKKMITSMNDDLHWWTIASLYKVDGSEDIILADTFTFKLQSVYTDLQFECKVAYNQNNIENPFSVSIVNSNIHLNTFEDVLPSLRIIYNKEAEAYSGAVLQIGLKLKNILNETLAIEDVSGKESCWKLITPSAIATNPEDDLIILPSTVVWDNSSEFSFSLETVLPMEYNIYNGDPINLTSGDNSIPVSNNIINENLPIISFVKLVINPVDTPSEIYSILIPVTMSGKLIGSASCYINTTKLTFTIDHLLGSNAIVNMVRPNQSDPPIAIRFNQYIIK